MRGKFKRFPPKKRSNKKNTATYRAFMAGLRAGKRSARKGRRGRGRGWY